MGRSRAAEQLALDLEPESAHDLYHRAPCGYLVTADDGTIARVNRTFLDWTGYDEADLVVTRRFADLLSPGSRIFYETHLAPLLALQDEVREIAVEVVHRDGSRLPVFVNAMRVEATDAVPGHDRITVFDAFQRREYEAELLRARRAAEASEQQVRSVAETLQRSLMHGGVTSGPGFEVETRYRPATAALEIGGDWHDAFLLDHGRTLAVTVGDVVGRGITAACAMGQLRTAMRALAGTGLGPGPLLDQIDGFVAGMPDARFATVAYAEVELTTGEVHYACAGHLPPLVISGAGEATYLWDGRSNPVASVRRGDPRPTATTTLEPGSRLLLYTDGLVERRSSGIDDGLERLRVAATASLDLPVVEQADRVMTDLLADEDGRDDVCLLVLHHKGNA